MGPYANLLWARFDALCHGRNVAHPILEHEAHICRQMVDLNNHAIKASARPGGLDKGKVLTILGIHALSFEERARLVDAQRVKPRASEHGNVERG